MSPLLPRASRPASSSSLLRLFLLLILPACLIPLPASSQRNPSQLLNQVLVVDAPTTLPPGGTVNLGTYTSAGSFTNGLRFHFTEPVTIQSAAYDPGPGGAQELVLEGIYGASCFYNQQLPADSECGVETGISALYPGLRSGTLRITTTSGVFIIPVTFNATLPQVALTPGVLSSPITIASQPVTQTGDSIAVDAVGSLFLGDYNSHVIRKVDATTGAVSIYAGIPGNTQYSGDGGPATSAAIMSPKGLSVSPAGDLYILTVGVSSNDILRKVDLGTGKISTAATAITGRSISVFAPAPDGAAVADQNGTIFLAVPFQYKIDAISNGVTTTIVNGTVNGAPCNASPVYQPFAMTVGGGYLYFYSQGAIYKVSTDTTQCNPVIRVAGTGLGGNSGDWGPATSATFSNISGLALDAAGNLYLADSLYNEVRVVNATTGQISPVAGPNTYLYSVTVLPGLSSLAIDVRGNLYVLGTNDQVQKIDVSQANRIFEATEVGSISTDSPKYTYATNIGNTTLPAGTTTIPTDYIVDPSSTCMDGTGAYPALAAGATCFTAIDFKPTTISAPPGQVLFGGATINLSGAANPPAATTTAVISPSSIDFGTVMQGQSSGTWTVNIRNTGSNPLTVVGAALTDPTDFHLGGNCSAPIAPYSSCNLTLVFTPQSAGSLGAILALTDNAAGGVQDVLLSGNATSNAPVIAVSPSSINFGTLQIGTTSPTWTVNVANKGASPLSIFHIFLSDPVDYSMVNPCGVSIPAYSSCNIAITFKPTINGVQNGQLVIDLNGGLPETVVALIGSGTGQAPPTLQLSPSSIDFGSVGVGGSSGVWTLYIGNPSATPVTISSIALSDTTNFHLYGTCSALPAYGSCEETVTFTPQSKATFNASIVLTDNASGGTQTVALTGNGSDPNYTVAVTPSVLTLRSGQTGNALFAFTPTGGFTGSVNLACNGLPAGATCTFSPAIFTADGSNTPLTSKVTVTTIGLGPQSSIISNRGGIAFAGLLGLLTLGGLRRRRKTIPALLLALLVFAGVTTLSGCGSGIFGSVTPTGNHAISVTATATATQKTQTGTANVGSSSQAAQLTLTIVE